MSTVNKDDTTNKISILEKLLYELLFMIPLCVVEASVVQLYLENRINSWPEEKITQLVVLGWLAIIMGFRHWKSRFRYLIPITISVVFMGILWFQSPETRWEFFLQYSWFFVMLLVAVLALLSGQLIAGRKWLERVTAGGLGTGLIVSIILRRDLQKHFVVAVLFYVCVILVEEVQRRWEKRGITHVGRHAVSVSAFLAAQMLIVFLIPVSKDKFEWSFVKDLWEQVVDNFQYASRFFYTGGEQLGGVIGLSEDGGFFANIQDDEQKICTLTCSRDTGEILYLRANVFDVFDGRNWSYQGYKDAAFEEDPLDLLETWCAIRTYEPVDYADYMWKAQLQLNYSSVHTQYVFAPMKSILPKELEKEGEITWQNGAYRTTQMAGYGTNISYHFYRLNRQHEIFQTFLEKAPFEPPTKEMWEEALRAYKNTEFDADNEKAPRNRACTYEDYLKYHETVMTNVDETELSDEVQKYMDELLDGAKSDYEKLDRIEKMLKTMTYTVNPGVLPEYVQSPADFLDELLLHSQQGYCSHFATAFVLLARSQGIPARYVQGYYIRRNDENTIEVKSGMAHAWAEAYIDGVGWISFEPTPGKSSGQAWYVADKEPVETKNVSHNPYENQEKTIALPDVVERVEEPKKSIEWGKIAGIVAAWIVLCFILFVGNRVWEKKRFQKLSVDKRFRLLCDRNEKVLKWLGLELEQGESLEEFGRRTSHELPKKCISYLERMEEVFYGGYPVDQSMCEEVLTCNEQLWKELKERKGKKYIFYILRQRN